ncbi:hypothetical protein [Streptomyces plicatus]|uniref:Uncharacterized protein n=1 Tax=Streptomyces plicatus TaxID=1922 RepID=A0ABW1Y296_STRPL
MPRNAVAPFTAPTQSPKPPASDAGEITADDSTGTPHAEGEADEIPPYGGHALEQIP